MSSSSVRQQTKPVLTKLVHAARVALVIALLSAIPAAPRSMSDGSIAPMVGELPSQAVDPGEKIDAKQDANGLWRVIDENDQPQAYIARTLPVAKKIVGYRGPSEAAIVLDDQLTIVSVGLLNSADTREHVDAMVGDATFFEQFKGWPWGGPPVETQIDGVSGATLTSLALAEGVLKRIGGARPSLVFSDPVSVSEIRDWFPHASSIDESTGAVQTANDGGHGRGQVLRTGPHSDDVAGYQGPTEMLIRINSDEVIDAIRIRRSFDNEPYVDYVRNEVGFWNVFCGKTIVELAAFDPPSAGVEGVSGATMTSLAVADTLVAAAQRVTAQKNAARSQRTTTSKLHSTETLRWSNAEIATIAMLCSAGLLSLLGWFRYRITRRLWLSLVVVVIGLWAGNLISMSLVAGWAAEGIGWRLAPGLSAIAFVSLLWPPLTKSNPYCNHLCPHGSIQQLIKPGTKSWRRWKPPSRMIRWFAWIPGITLAVAYGALIVFPTIDLSSWEPFHAYVFRVASWGSIVLAMATLAFSAVIPMGYCRLGCPTGRLIAYLRRTSQSHRITMADGVAASLLIVAWSFRGF